MNEKLPNTIRELLDDFSYIDNQEERTEMLIFYANQFKEVPKEIAKRPYSLKNLVPACESKAYVWSELNDEKKIKYYFAVENPQGISAKAMAAILDETLSGLNPQEIINIEPDIVFEFFGKKLSMGKTAGLTNLVAMVVSHAKSYL